METFGAKLFLRAKTKLSESRKTTFENQFPL